MKRFVVTIGTIAVVLGLAFTAMSVTTQQIGIGGKQVYTYDQATGFARMEVILNAATSFFGYATEDAPTLTEGAEANFSFDLAGNLRATLGTLLSGEDQTNNLLMTGAGMTRITTIGPVTSATSSQTTTVPSGPKTFMAQMESGSSESVAFDLTIYGNWTNSATGAQEVCRIWVPASTTTSAIQDKCPPVNDAYTYWFYTASVYTSASGRDLTVYAMY